MRGKGVGLGDAFIVSFLTSLYQPPLPLPFLIILRVEVCCWHQVPPFLGGMLHVRLDRSLKGGGLGGKDKSSILNIGGPVGVAMMDKERLVS
jgi:hypothetical protein